MFHAGVSPGQNHGLLWLLQRRRLLLWGLRLRLLCACLLLQAPVLLGASLFLLQLWQRGLWGLWGLQGGLWGLQGGLWVLWLLPVWLLQALLLPVQLLCPHLLPVRLLPVRLLQTLLLPVRLLCPHLLPVQLLQVQLLCPHLLPVQDLRCRPRTSGESSLPRKLPSQFWAVLQTRILKNGVPVTVLGLSCAPLSSSSPPPTCPLKSPP
ncbi:uncharacterized protein LOC130684782 [Manis pentadactyla]|uniref:uncharacterized protein LOC130684782 n=1 Tax=Manis pentadactyla TaxID=143292 RepID=UPI00255CF3C0|nr:uncharacterized protein LOC130684782 [Manis pentadactyla]